jgi:hypothetical protein
MPLCSNSLSTCVHWPVPYLHPAPKTRHIHCKSVRTHSLNDNDNGFIVLILLPCRVRHLHVPGMPFGEPSSDRTPLEFVHCICYVLFVCEERPEARDSSFRLIWTAHQYLPRVLIPSPVGTTRSC